MLHPVWLLFSANELWRHRLTTNCSGTAYIKTLIQTQMVHVCPHV